MFYFIIIILKIYMYENKEETQKVSSNFKIYITLKP